MRTFARRGPRGLMLRICPTFKDDLVPPQDGAPGAPLLYCTASFSPRSRFLDHSSELINEGCIGNCPCIIAPLGGKNRPQGFKLTWSNFLKYDQKI